MKNINQLMVASLILVLYSPVEARDYNFKWSGLRLFLTETQFANKSTELNNLLTVDSIEPLNKVSGFGIEATAELSSRFKVGTKAKGIFAGSNKKEAPFPATEYLSLQQYSVGLNGRYDLVASKNILFDVYVELGLSNNSIELKSTAGTAKWEKDAHFYQRAGSSLGFGNEDFKFYIEGGYEFFNLNDLKHSGTIGQNIKSLDLSGPYIGVGMTFGGLPDWIKPGGISVGD